VDGEGLVRLGYESLQSHAQQLSASRPVASSDHRLPPWPALIGRPARWADLVVNVDNSTSSLGHARSARAGRPNPRAQRSGTGAPFPELQVLTAL